MLGEQDDSSTSCSSSTVPLLVLSDKHTSVIGMSNELWGRPCAVLFFCAKEAVQRWGMTLLVSVPADFVSKTRISHTVMVDFDTTWGLDLNAALCSE